MATVPLPELVQDELTPEQFDDGVNSACDGQNDGRLVTLERYLHTSYSPDCDFVDGALEERKLGEIEHVRLQRRLLLLFAAQMDRWNIEPLKDLRLQITPTRFRVPDLLILRADQAIDRFVREAPLLCIEILSPEDTFQRLHARVRDYLALGVPNIWAFDPETAEAFLCDADGFHKVHAQELAIAGTPVRVKLADVFGATVSSPQTGAAKRKRTNA